MKTVRLDLVPRSDIQNYNFDDETYQELNFLLLNSCATYHL